MKPAPFEYHAPTTVDEALGLLAELGDEAKVLAGGQSLVPMLNLRLARFDHLVDIGRIEELRGHRAPQRRRCVIGAGTRDSVIEFDPTVAAAVPLLAAVTPLHRALPDPQPGHHRRLAGPRRSGRRVPGGGRRARRHVRHRRRPRASRRCRRPTSSPACGRRRWRTASCCGRSPSPSGAGAAGSASPSSPAATATSPSPAPSPPSSSVAADVVARCAVAVFGVGGTPTRAIDDRGGDHRAAVGRDRRRRGRPSRRWTRSTTSPTTRRCRRTTGGGSGRRWSPTPGDAPSTTPTTTRTEPDERRRPRSR